jgi:hypothetical protein
VRHAGPARAAFAAAVTLGLVLALPGCNGSSTTAKQGTVVIRARATSLAVSDTMTLSVGVRYTNGTFVPLTLAYGIASQNASIATVDSTTRVMRGVAVGDVVLRVIISGGLSFDSTFSVTP